MNSNSYHSILHYPDYEIDLLYSKQKRATIIIVINNNNDNNNKNK